MVWLQLLVLVCTAVLCSGKTDLAWTSLDPLYAVQRGSEPSHMLEMWRTSPKETSWKAERQLTVRDGTGKGSQRRCWPDTELLLSFYGQAGEIDAVDLLFQGLRREFSSDHMGLFLSGFKEGGEQLETPTVRKGGVILGSPFEIWSGQLNFLCLQAW